MYRLVSLLLVAVSACAPVYIPNVRNSPMFTKSREFQASAQIGNGVELQSAYAVSEHVGVMANYAWHNSNAEDETNFHRHKFLEAGIGYFTNKNDSFFEIFAGYGRGQSTSYDSYEFFGSASVSATGRYSRYFIQPGVGLNKGPVNVSFAPRFSIVDFYEFSTELTRTSVKEAPKVFFEPAVIGRANFADGHMYATFQSGASLGMNESLYFDRRVFTFSAGIGLRLGAIPLASD